MTAIPSAGELRNVILGIFEQVRQSPNAPYEPERLLAFLTEPPAQKGRRVADTFAGRRRLVRFMNTVQFELGICFTLDEWERGFGLDDMIKLAAANLGSDQFGVLTLPLMVWTAVTGGVAALAISEFRYSQKLVGRIEALGLG